MIEQVTISWQKRSLLKKGGGLFKQEPVSRGFKVFVFHSVCRDLRTIAARLSFFTHTTANSASWFFCWCTVSPHIRLCGQIEHSWSLSCFFIVFDTSKACTKYFFHLFALFFWRLLLASPITGAQLDVNAILRAYSSAFVVKFPAVPRILISMMWMPMCIFLKFCPLRVERVMLSGLVYRTPFRISLIWNVWWFEIMGSRGYQPLQHGRLQDSTRWICQVKGNWSGEHWSMCQSFDASCFCPDEFSTSSNTNSGTVYMVVSKFQDIRCSISIRIRHRLQ